MGANGRMDQGTIGKAAESKAKCDLLRNPFVLLRVALTATKEEVADAFNEAIAEGWHGDEILRDARRQLLAPKLRLAATVDMLVDATPQQQDLAISALEDGAPFSELISLAKDLPSAARSVFMSNLAQLWPSSGALRYYALALASIDRPGFDVAIKEIFEEAGLPTPNAASVNEAFDASIARNVKRLFSGYRDTKVASSDIRRCIEEGIASATEDQVAAYTSLIRSYQEYAAASIGDLRRRVVASTEIFLENTQDTSTLDQLETDLRSWDELSQPAQLVAQRKGRDDPEARELFEQLRGFMIKLANEKNAVAAALRLSKVCVEVFAELPRAAAQLEEDLNTLQGLLDQQGAQDLLEFVERMRANLTPLVSELRRGFGATATGNAWRLYELFNGAVAATKGTAASDLPWAALRGLALDLNNELGEGAASEAIISALVNHRGFQDTSQQTQSAIRADHRVIRMNAAQERFKRAIDKKDTTEARLALEVMAGLATEDSERRQFQQAIANLDAAKRSRIVRWIFWAIVIFVGILIAANQSNNRSGSSYSSTPYRPPTTTNYSPPAQLPAVANNEEVKPSAYSTAAFSQGNVRYCKFESARIEAAQRMMVEETNRVIALFNQAVDDYNSRCANYRYYVDDLTTVQRELVAKQGQINTDARSLLQRWRMMN